MLWLPLVLGSAASASVAALISKCISDEVEPKVAMAIRGVVVLLMVGSAVLISGKFQGIFEIPLYSLAFILISGAALAWARIFYFEALARGDVGKVSAVNKTSASLAIFMSFVFLGVGLTYTTFLSAVLILVGAAIMIEGNGPTKDKWLMLAIASAICGAAYTVLGKPGSQYVDPFLATGIRAIVFFIITWTAVYISGKKVDMKNIGDSDKGIIILSGVFFGLSWLLLYYAIQVGPVDTVSVLDRLSLPIIVICSYFLLGERMNKRSLFGILIMTLGILTPLVELLM
ncbi:MAG: EamA family transporter [Candidatus Methanomethylophilaceae archaeon]|jgi:transporter family protein